MYSHPLTDFIIWLKFVLYEIVILKKAKKKKKTMK